MKKDPAIFLEHILKSISKIEEYLQGVDEELFHISEDKQDLIVRRIEVIGEATKNLPDELRQKYPDIPWKRMAGMRDVMIHQYFGIDYNVVWKTAIEFLPSLRDKIKKILQEYEI